MAAGTTVARINTIVTANTTQFTAAMAKAQTRAGKFAAAAGAAAKAASGPLTMGLLAVGGAAVKAATDFDDSMTKIESLVGIAGEEVDAMKDSVKALAGETAQAPAKLADAMFFIQSAGLRGATAMETLEASAKAASVGLGDVEQIADLATSALNAYGAENLSATDATDVLTAAVREGKLEAAELSGAMGQTLPVASAMGVRFDEVGAAFAAMSRTGTGASEAATQLRGILSTLLRPSKDAEKTLNNMGMSAAGLRQQIKDEGLLAVLQTLVGAFDGNAAATASVFGNVRALTGVLDLMGAGAATTEQIFASMEDTTGTLNTAFEVVSDTAGFKFQKAMADVQAALVGIGEKVLPIVLTMLEGAQSMVDAFKALPTPIKLTAAALAALVVASGPIGQISLAVGGLLFAFGKMGEESRKAKSRQEALTDEFKAANDPAATMIDRMTELAASIEDVADEADDATRPVGDFVGSNLALGMAIDKEVLPLFDDLGISMDDIAAAAEGGSDEFQKLQGTFINVNGDTSRLKDGFDDLTEAERKVAEKLLDARIAGDLTAGQFSDMLDVVDETADAFDDNRKELEKQSEAFIESADAVKLLNDANLDGEKILAEWTRTGLSYTEMARRIDNITREMTTSADGYSIEAHRAGIETRNLASETEALEEPVDDLAEALDEAAESAKSLEEEFRKLMNAIQSESEAIHEAEMLARDFDEIVASMGEKSVPELATAFFEMSEDAAASIGNLIDSGVAVDGPEMRAAFLNFATNVGAIGQAAGRSVAEVNEAISAFERMSGTTIPVSVKLDIIAPSFGVTPGELADQIGGIYGSTPFTPTTPAPAPTPVNPGDYPFFYGATGGIVRRPTMALIGEAGPEAVVPLSSAPGASPLPSDAGMGGTTMNVTVNMPVGSDGAEVVRSLQRYARAHGGTVPILTGQL